MKKISFWTTVIVLFLTYFLLAFRAPFGIRSLIPNLEPYPDTLYYATPAWNFIHGQGFAMKSRLLEVKQQVAPLYSIYLVPFFAIFRDVRSYYFANLILGLSSLVFLIISCKKLFKNNFIVFFLGFIYITNFYIYYLPALLMAENISLFLTNMGLYFLLSKPTKAKTVIAGLLGGLFWFAKLSNGVIGLVFYIFYWLKIRKEKIDKRLFFGPFLFILFLFISYINNSQILIEHKNAQSFNFEYLFTNFKFYILSLFGGEGKYLWFNYKFINILTGLLAFAGLTTGLINKKTRLISAMISIFIFSVLISVSLFEAQDIRFILFIFPPLIILIGFVFQYMKEKKYRSFLLVLSLIFLIYLSLPALNQRINEIPLKTFKKQVGLNFKHSEVPWNYIAIQNFNNYFIQKESNIYLGTVLPVFYVDYFSNKNYKYLPITANQDFFGNAADLQRKYFSLLKEGNKVYVSNAYLGNLELWRKDFNNLIRNFNVSLVKQACLGSCNIYQLSLKNEVR